MIASSMAPWTERALWLALGAALAVGGYLLFDSPGPTRAGEATGAAAGTDESPGAARSGELETPPPECYLGVVLTRQAVDVAAEIDGVLEQVGVRTGDRVDENERIARLDTRVLDEQLAVESAGLEIAEAQTRRMEHSLSEAQREHERAVSLNAQGLLSDGERESAEFNLKKVEADLDAARATARQARLRIRQIETTLSKAEVRAPFDAIVAQRYLDPGARVVPGSPIVRLISSGSLLTRFAVPPEQTDRVPVETEVRVEIEPLRRAFPAVVEQLAPEIDEAAQMVFVEARLAVPPEAAPEIPSGAVARISVASAEEATGSCLTER